MDMNDLLNIAPSLWDWTVGNKEQIFSTTVSTIVAAVFLTLVNWLFRRTRRIVNWFSRRIRHIVNWFSQRVSRIASWFSRRKDNGFRDDFLIAQIKAVTRSIDVLTSQLQVKDRQMEDLSRQLADTRQRDEAHQVREQSLQADLEEIKAAISAIPKQTEIPDDNETPP